MLYIVMLEVFVERFPGGSVNYIVSDAFVVASIVIRTALRGTQGFQVRRERVEGPGSEGIATVLPRDIEITMYPYDRTVSMALSHGNLNIRFRGLKVNLDR